MPQVFICATEDGPELVRQVNPECLISATDCASEVPMLNYLGYTGAHYIFRTENILAPPPYQLRPPSCDMALFIGFIAPYCGAGAKIVHTCRGGLSISPALAYITLCYGEPDVDEKVLAARLRDICPDMQPNMQLVAIGDKMLKRDGQMIDALKSEVLSNGQATHPIRVA